ncbi:MAG: hypothetical protein ABJB76_13025 [Candidatus Nitrosocosmicus sp.]
MEELIIKKSGIKYHYTHTYTESSENEDSNRKYQEKYMLTQHPQKRKRNLKKDRTNTCGCSKPLPTTTAAAAATTRRRSLYRSIIRRIVFLL